MSRRGQSSIQEPSHPEARSHLVGANHQYNETLLLNATLDFQLTAQLFNILDAAHEALISGVPTTKRDVFYKDVALFKSQQVVNQLVDDLAATWDLKRSDLSIVSVPLIYQSRFLTPSAESGIERACPRFGDHDSPVLRRDCDRERFRRE